MALDPRLSLGVRTANVGEAFSNALLNVQRLQGIQQQPLRNRLLEAQTGQAEAGVTEGQQINKIRSLAVFANDISGDLLNNDLGAIRAKTVQRIGQDLPNQGLASTESQDLLNNVIDNPNLTDEQKIAEVGRLSQNITQFAQQSGVLKAPVGAGGLASAKTEILPDGSVVQALPNGQVQVRNPQGQIVTGQARADVLATSQQAGLAIKQRESDIAVSEARGKATATQRASRVSEITKELSTRSREAKRGEINLAQAAKLVERAEQGVAGASKLRLAKLFPGIDVSNEAALSQSLTNLALDELQKFKGPTTDFEFQKTEQIAGTLGDSKTANRAKVASLQRANWFVQRESKQFRDHVKAGKDPDTFGFDFGEQIKTSKGAFSLQDIQDTAVANNISIDETIKRLNK